MQLLSEQLKRKKRKIHLLWSTKRKVKKNIYQTYYQSIKSKS